jgi:GNAT superfamily N-acetyltransferase
MEQRMASYNDVNAAFEAWLDATEDVPEQSGAVHLRYRRYGHTQAALETESGFLVLCRIETPPEYRGQGSASRLIDLLKDICDRYNLTLLGQASAYDSSGLEQEALLQWYERHGFESDHDRTAQPLVWYPARPGSAR